MDSGNIIFTAVIIVLCAFPFVLMHWNRSQKIKNLKNAFFQKAGEFGYQTTTFEIFGEWCIGLDESNKVFCYFKKDKTKDVFIHVHLSKISDCLIQKSHKTIFNNNTSHEVIDKLGFVFKPSDKSGQDVNITLFTLEQDMQLSGELQLAEKWIKPIQTAIKP